MERERERAKSNLNKGKNKTIMYSINLIEDLNVTLLLIYKHFMIPNTSVSIVVCAH